MSRLQAEYQRLYLHPAAEEGAPDAAFAPLAHGQARAMLLALARPADWGALSSVWRGVQVDLNLPAPAIAVNGTDAFELWFSLAKPVPVAQAQAFLNALRLRYLPEVVPGRLRLRPAVEEDASDASATVVERVPKLQAGSGNWSAFVAPDLAAVFGEDPWIDFPPGADAQAELLSRLASATPAEFQTALARLQPRSLALSATAMSHDAPARLVTGVNRTHAVDGAGPYQDPRAFLLDVMNDASVALALRVDAAKALLVSKAT
jgi:hypothetical protein